MKTWLNVSEAAEYAGVSRDTIYTAAASGDCHARLGAPCDPTDPSGSMRGWSVMQ
jgi:hypothetical protein